MAIITELDTDIGRVRLEIGDNIDERGKGVKPTGANFTDEEIQYFLTVEGSVGRATAHACEALANAWSRVPDSIRGNRADHFTDVAESYRKQAAALRQQYGGGAGLAMSAPTIRVDGYSQRADEGEF